MREAKAILLIRTRGQASSSGVGKRAGRPRYGYLMLSSTSDPEITLGCYEWIGQSVPPTDIFEIRGTEKANTLKHATRP